MANRQEIVCDYIYDNYVQFSRLRHDVISDKLVIKGSIKKPMSMVQLGMLLRKSGFQSKQFGSSRTRGWLVRERSTDEVNANRNIEGRTP